MGDGRMNAQLKEIFANVKEVELNAMDNEDKELFSAMEELDKSGRIALRIPKSRHAKLVEQAHREGVSLNQYCLYKLAN